MVNRTEELKTKILLLCYGKEIRNRKGAGLFVEQRGTFSLSCDLVCNVGGIIPSLLLFTFLRGLGGKCSGSTLAFGSIPQKGTAFADGGWTTTCSSSLIVVLLCVSKKALRSPYFCHKLCNYSPIEQWVSGALELYTFYVYFVVVA